MSEDKSKNESGGVQRTSSISDMFIDRPVMTVLLSIAAAFFGIFAYKAMPVNDLPGVDYPVIQVSVSYPGADPTIMGANVASPLEQQFMQIPGIEMITSRNSTGASSIILQFSLSKNIDAAATDVQSAIQRAMGNLPADLPSPPSFTKDNPNDMPIYIISATSNTLTEGDLYDYAYSQVAQQLNMVDGVSKVDIYAAPKSVRIEVDVRKLYNLGYTMTDLSNALSRSTNMTGTGSINGPTTQYILFPDTQLSSAKDYETLVIGYKDGSPIYLRDIAKAVESIQFDTLNISFYNKLTPTTDSTTSIAMGIRKRADGNAVTTVAGIKKMMERFKHELPETIKLYEFYDRSQLIVDNIEDVKETLLIAFVLVVFVIFFFLGRFRDTLIPSIALPFSVLLTFIFMYAFGFSLNNLSLMGITMAIGFLVDDAIVFLENTVRRMEDFGESPRVATIKSASEISFTILSMTLSLAAVFIPLAFMSGIMGRVFKEFSVTIIVATLMSGVVSLTLTPMMCSRTLNKRTKDYSDKTAVEKIAYNIEKAFLKFYSPTLSWMLKQNVLTFAIMGVCLYGVVYFASVLPQIFFPIGDSGFMQGVFITNTKTSPKELGKVQNQIAEIMKQTPDIKNFVMVSGVSAFINQNMGFSFVVLEDKDKRRPIQEVANEINNRASMIPGVVSAFQPQPTLKISTGATSTQQGKYAYAISSMNQNELYATAEKIQQLLSSKRGVYFSNIQSDLYLDNPQITLKPYRDKASMLGLSVNSYSDVFRQSFAKSFFYLIKSPFQQYWTIMESKDVNNAFEDTLNEMMFTTDATLTGGYPVRTFANGGSEQNPAYKLSNLIPFSSISTKELVLAPVSINHLNNFPSVTFYFDLNEGVAIGDVVKWVNQETPKVMPQSVSGMFIGEAVTFQETMRSLMLLIGVAIFVMYVILGILYESYVHPITVLSALPIAVVGGLASLWFFDMELSIYSAIGIFMLMGIVKKNGIMMIDFAIMREASGMKPIDAVHEACMERFRPIIMTSFAALMGMLPIALGWGKADAESRIPLGVVVVGGLIFSQLVTLYVTPVIYLWFDWLQTHVLDKIPFFARGTIGISTEGDSSNEK
ncbi:MAG: efflux RND transporter permease subunit [Opitutales bacterium]|nr:efflux RND transporter permease subunit [Opitutales bacterium]